MNKSIARVGLIGLSVVMLVAMAVFAAPTLRVAADTGANWTGQYWNNNSFTNNPVLTRTDASVNFNWGTGSPDASVPAGNFSARWTLTYLFAGGTYVFRAGDQGGVRAYVDSTLIIDKFTVNTSFQTYTATVNLAAGYHALRVDYFTQGGATGVLFDWTPPGGSAVTTTGTPTPVTTVAASTALQAVVITQIANIRSDPSTANPPVRQTFYGDTYTVIASTRDSSWFLIQDSSGQQGWIFHLLIYIYGGTTNTLPITTSPVTPVGQLANVQATVRIDVIVHDGPSQIASSAKKIGGFTAGTSVQVLALSRNQAWALVTANGLQGWVFVPYLTLTVGDWGNLPRHN